MDDIDIISDQTGITDKIWIERCYIENNRSVADTIMVLMEYDYCKENTAKERTVFDDIREIVSEKEKIFIDVMKGQRSRHE